MFQFLIGTLKTSKLSAEEILENRFQFLIGTLKTSEKIRDLLFETAVFQFLIGTLKTRLKYFLYLLLFSVSIPYRYA